MSLGIPIGKARIPAVTMAVPPLPPIPITPATRPFAYSWSSQIRNASDIDVTASPRPLDWTSLSVSPDAARTSDTLTSAASVSRAALTSTVTTSTIACRRHAATHSSSSAFVSNVATAKTTACRGTLSVCSGIGGVQRCSELKQVSVIIVDSKFSHSVVVAEPFALESKDVNVESDCPRNIPGAKHWLKFLKRQLEILLMQRARHG